MNREEKRRLARAAKSAAGSDGVKLIGGPMNDWFVASDAPALRADWGAKGGFKGRYVEIDPEDDGVRRAEWRQD